LIIGAAKSGTTSLYYYLNQHPDIFMSVIKEPHFFAYEDQTLTFTGPGDMAIMDTMIVTQRERYEELFQAARPGQARGEASAMYLNEPGVAERIAQHTPGMKLITILRQPADRAFSSYQHQRRDGWEQEPDFGRALALETERSTANWHPIWHYKRLGFYSGFLEQFTERFPGEQQRIYLFEDLVRDPMTLFRDAFDFIGVDPTFLPDTSRRYNESGIPKSMRLHRYLWTSTPLKRYVKQFIPNGPRERLVRGLQSRNLGASEQFDPVIRARLTAEYTDDIRQLERRIGRDLSHWTRT